MERFTSLTEIRQLLFDRQLTLPSVVEYYLEKNKQNTELNAIIEVFDQEALERSKQVPLKGSRT